MARPKKIEPIVDITAMHATAKCAVQTYRMMIEEINYIITNHPEVNRSFIVDTVLDQFGVDESWFSDMQEHHKQSIKDSVRGPKGYQ
jgi:flavorubredoxin